MLTGGDAVRLDLQRVANHQPPAWPDSSAPRRLHLDFCVGNLTQIEQQVIGLGATLAPHQPGGNRFRVLVDPAGHPFCIATTAAAEVPRRAVEPPAL
ncbi:VOC family protein [Nocardia miyunensis]|uniref:VOC family protein n=1 Tax=Nocardia miyunensis TaxID=282684 RepID=UPI00350E4A17